MLQLTLTEEEVQQLYEVLNFHMDMLDEDDDRVEVASTLLDKVSSLWYYT